MSAPPQLQTKSIDHVRIGLGDGADVVTTAAGLSQGFVEGNPLLSGAGAATPIVGLAGKFLMKKLLVATGFTPAQANVAVETGGWIGGCANFMTVAMKAQPAAALAVGVACGVIARHQLMKAARGE